VKILEEKYGSLEEPWASLGSNFRGAVLAHCQLKVGEKVAGNRNQRPYDVDPGPI
jgi:hypothetical protein